MNRYVIVTGLPASGKSTVARAIALALSLPLLDKDDFLEALFGSDATADANERHRLSRMADEAFREQAQSTSGAVLTSWWKHPQSPADSGTPTTWLSALPGLRVELHCRCSPALAAVRFIKRTRHPSHGDGHRRYFDLLAQFAQQASLGPLRVGRIVEVDTSSEVDHRALLPLIDSAFSNA